MHKFICCYLISKLSYGKYSRIYKIPFKMVKKIQLIITFFAAINVCFSKSVWKWECTHKFCQKVELNSSESVSWSLEECRVLCYDHGSIWPLPTGQTEISKNLLVINPESVNIIGIDQDKPIYNLSKAMGKIFKDNLPNFKKSKSAPKFNLTIILEVSDEACTKLTIDTSERYSILSTYDSTIIKVIIRGETIFGVRHGLETLSQLIVPDLKGQLKIPNLIEIIDEPVFPHRGISLDTSRNFVSGEVIQNLIKGMGASKLNTFHWHFSDTSSFPYYSKSLPELSSYGAYSPSKVYTPEIVEELVKFGLAHGVKILPEFDAPAHVGEGWQKTGFVVCMGKDPWQDYCGEPPCGQFDPTQPKLYDALEKLYGDLLKAFDPDMFHMGSDEVFFDCWNRTESITKWMRTEQGWNTTRDDFVKLWDYFQKRALERLRKAANKNIMAIVWTSDMTNYPEYLNYLSNKDYIVQVWTSSDDPSIKNLLNNGFKLIISNYDALYMDCGYSNFVSRGNNWCSPYKGWQTVYDNNLEKIAGDKIDQILGGETAMWSESVDEFAVESKLFPRSAALAERLWTNPASGWKIAEQRMLVQRERLVRLGVRADSLAPEWCNQNENKCPASPV